MKYAYIALFALIFVLGCEGVPGGDVGADCGTDTACFQANAQTCTPSFVEYEIDMVTLKLNILGGTPESCSMKVKVLQVNLPDDAPKSVKAAVPLAKRTSMICSLTGEQIASLSFGQETLDSCEGTLAEILVNFVEVEQVAPPSQEDEAEIPEEAYNEDGTIDWEYVCEYNGMFWDDAAGVCLEEAPVGVPEEPEPAPEEEAESFSTNPNELKVELVSITPAQGLGNIPGTEYHKRVNYLLSSKMEEAEYTFYTLYKETGAKSTITWKTIGGTPAEGGYEWNSLEGYVQLGPGEYELIFEDKSNAEVYTSFEVSIEAPEAEEGEPAEDTLIKAEIGSIVPSTGGWPGVEDYKKINYVFSSRREGAAYSLYYEGSNAIIESFYLEGIPTEDGYDWDTYEDSVDRKPGTYVLVFKDQSDPSITTSVEVTIEEPGEEEGPVAGIETASESTDGGLQVTITSVEGSMGGPMGDTPVKRIYYKVWVKRPLTKYNIQSQRGENPPVLITQSNMEGTPKDGGYSWNVYEKSMNVDYTDTYSIRVVATNDNAVLAFASIPVVQPGDEA